MTKDKYTYNDFTYQKQGDKEYDGVNIIHDKPYPEKVYKFYPINSYSVDALMNGYFYASHSFELNDYMDANPFLLHTSNPLSYDLYKGLFEDIMPEDKLQEFYNVDINRDNLCKGYISKYWEVISNISGIISLTAAENSILMWPHYTQEKGFQLTFNASALEVSIKDKIEGGECFGMFPINYTSNLHSIDIYEYDTMHVPFFYATNVKSNKWVYEKEWRFLIGKPMMGVPYSKIGLNTNPDFITSPVNRYTYYDKDILEQITLGMNFFTAEDFNMEWLNERQFKVSPKKIKNNWNFKSHKTLLAYIYRYLPCKIFHSGVKYEKEEDGSLFLIRTKERLEIEQVGWDTYVFTRTEEVIKIF
jgi:hypothetical protein